MPRYEYENVTGAHLIDNTLRPHWSQDADKYSLPLYVSYESDAPDEYDGYDRKVFYGEITFSLPGDKLAGATLTFRHEGTEWSEESKGLRPEEAEEIIGYIGEYLNDLSIRAKLSIVQHIKEGNFSKPTAFFVLLQHLSDWPILTEMPGTNNTEIPTFS